MRRTRIVAVLLLGACLLAPVGAQVRTDVPYRILVSNDDGVNAPGLAAVAKTLQAIGDVTIVAPSVNQSGKGHSIVTSEPVFRQDLTLPNGLHAIGLTATPATTVNIAIRNIVTPSPDLVVSGINRGYNLGLTNYVSGTVGAAREAAMHGIPAIAASLSDAGVPQDYGAAAEEVLAVARRLKQFGMSQSKEVFEQNLKGWIEKNGKIETKEQLKALMTTSAMPPELTLFLCVSTGSSAGDPDRSTHSRDIGSIPGS